MRTKRKLRLRLSKSKTVENIIREGVKEVNLVLAGKLKARPLKEVLAEL